MSNIGFYSRHLSDQDIDNFSAARVSSLAIPPVGSVEQNEFNHDRAAESILNGLLNCGNYENIIKNIFEYLNATQLACLQKTCRSWDNFIEDTVWSDEKLLGRLRQYWGSYMPHVFCLTYCRTLLSMAVTPGIIACGVEKTGQVVLYNRAALYKKEVEQPVIPFERLQVSKEGSSVTTLDLQDQTLVTGASDGSVCVYDLSRSKMVERVAQGGSMVYQVRLRGDRLAVTAGSKITVHQISLTQGSRLTHVVTGHTRDVLCLDLAGEVLVSGGLDTNVLVTKLGEDQESQLLHTLSGHKLKVRCVSVWGQHAVTGSWDRTAILWDLITGTLLRTIKHEMQVRCIAMDSERIVTGDMEGYVFAWDLKNCLDGSCGPEKLCLRAHNAMDPDIMVKDSEKIVYGVHLERGAMVQVAGTTGRIVLQDFYDYTAPDIFQLESYVHDTPVHSLVV